MDSIWRQLSEASTTSPKAWMDTYLAAFAIPVSGWFMDEGPRSSRRHARQNPHSFRFSSGNSTTSRIVGAPVSIITSRSIPMPMPPAGGMPCSRVSMKS